MKQVKSTAISVFALALAFMWLAPLVWLVGTAFSEPTFHMTFFPNSRFTFGNLSYYRKVLAEIKLCKLMILPKEGIENRR